MDGEQQEHEPMRRSTVVVDVAKAINDLENRPMAALSASEIVASLIADELTRAAPSTR